MNFGLPELIVIFFIIMLLFGSSKLPGLGAGLGKALRSFKDAMKGGQEEEQKPAPKPPPADGPKA